MSQAPTSNPLARRIRPAVVALLAVIAATALASAPAQAAPRTFYGLVPNEDLTAADHDLIRQANVGAARVGLFWNRIEAANGQFDWTETDRFIGGLAAANVRVLPMLYGTPRWLTDNPNRPPVSKRQRNEWSEFVAAAVRRYGNGGTFWTTVYPALFPGGPVLPPKAYQMWNEVNGPKHFLPKPNVGKYTRMLQAAKKPVKQNDRKADIVTAGLVSKPTGKGGMKGWLYLKKLLKKKQAKRAVDHAALHPYAGNDKQVLKDAKRMRKALKKGGKKKGQLWITEVGWSSANVKGKLGKSSKQQAKLLKKTYKGLARQRGKLKIGGVYWYTWRDTAGGVCSWCPTAGLVTESGQPKPSYNQFKKVAG